MGILLQIIAVSVCFGLIYLIFHRMREKKMSESQALPWLIGVFGLLVLSIFPKILHVVASILGIWWAPSILIFFLIILFAIIIFHHTMMLSQLEARVYELSMQLVVLKERNQQLENEVSGLSEKSEVKETK